MRVIGEGAREVWGLLWMCEDALGMEGGGGGGNLEVCKQGTQRKNLAPGP